MCSKFSWDPEKTGRSRRFGVNSSVFVLYSNHKKKAMIFVSNNQFSINIKNAYMRCRKMPVRQQIPVVALINILPKKKPFSNIL